MKNSTFTFCKKYLQKLKNDKEIKENEVDFFRDYVDRISFTVNVHANNPHKMKFGGFGGTETLTLDEEDLGYLYNKYSKKLQSELERNIEEMLLDYKKL